MLLTLALASIRQLRVPFLRAAHLVRSWVVRLPPGEQAAAGCLLSRVPEAGTGRRKRTCSRCSGAHCAP